MHLEALAFLQSTLTPSLVEGKRVLELGSYNVNGSARVFCGGAAEYVGVDRRDGPGVDVVNTDDSYNGKEAFDVVVSSETLEHADNPAALITVAWNALRPGGMLVLTAAGPDREKHTCDGAPLGDSGEPYQAVTKKALTELLSDWSEVDVAYAPSHGRERGDVYAIAIKPLDAKPVKATTTTRRSTKKDAA